MNLQALESERVEAIFHRHGALAITYSDAADDPVLEPLPGETPLWQNSCITGLFPESTDFAPLENDLLREFDIEDLPPRRVEDLVDRAWEREWLRDFQPMRFGERLWVCPVHGEAPAAPAVVIRLDPGLAFGTGTHATTALCLERLDSMDINEKRVLDFGCGSGILAIGALLLGARDAMAYDIDPQAVTASLRNAAQNEVGDRLKATDEPGRLGGGYDVVLANILAGPLVELAKDITDRLVPGGKLVLSGILADQAGALLDAYGCRIRFDEPLLLDGWACLSGERTGT